MAFFKRLIGKIAENIPVVRGPGRFSMALPGVILKGKSWNGESTKIHEQTHSKQQIKDPFFFARYALDKSYRWRMEKEAVTVEVAYYKKNNIPINWDALKNSLMNDYRSMASATEIQKFIEQLKSTMNPMMPPYTGK